MENQEALFIKSKDFTASLPKSGAPLTRSGLEIVSQLMKYPGYYLRKDY